MVYDIMNDSQRKNYEEFLEVDFSFEIEGLARFRVNAFNQNRGAAPCSGPFPQQDPDAGAAQRAQDLCRPGAQAARPGAGDRPHRLGQVHHAGGMVNYLNETEYGHILTVEDPIEFVHESKKCLVNQREVGPHTLSFAAALKSALREDPDAILVGEMRDLETIRLAMTAAETGHLVFGTLHTSSAAKTIDRIIDVFPAEEKEMVRAMLSESLQAVISQTLCKTKDGQGRVAAHEIMLGTSAIRNLIREAKVAQMYSSIQTGNSVGMQTLDQNLTDLVKRNIISRPKPAARPRFPRTSPADASTADTGRPPRPGAPDVKRHFRFAQVPTGEAAGRTRRRVTLFSTSVRRPGRVDAPAGALGSPRRRNRLPSACKARHASCCRRCGQGQDTCPPGLMRSNRTHGAHFVFAPGTPNRDVIRQDEYGNFMLVLLSRHHRRGPRAALGRALRLAETSAPAKSWARCRCWTAASAFRPAPHDRMRDCRAQRRRAWTT
jgi:twitching motility protein PilT